MRFLCIVVCGRLLPTFLARIFLLFFSSSEPWWDWALVSLLCWWSFDQTLTHSIILQTHSNIHAYNKVQATSCIMSPVIHFFFFFFTTKTLEDMTVAAEGQTGFTLYLGREDLTFRCCLLLESASSPPLQEEQLKIIPHWWQHRVFVLAPWKGCGKLCCKVFP